MESFAERLYEVESKVRESAQGQIKDWETAEIYPVIGYHPEYLSEPELIGAALVGAPRVSGGSCLSLYSLEDDICQYIAIYDKKYYCKIANLPYLENMIGTNELLFMKKNYNNIDLLFGDISFVNNNVKIVRHFSAKKFTPAFFRLGLMPPHPSVYIKRSIYLKYGLYNINLKIASDFELLLRYLKVNNLRHMYVNSTIVYMRFGGVSNSSFKNRLLLNREILKACSINNFRTNYFLIYSKYLFKILEYLSPFFNRNRN